MRFPSTEIERLASRCAGEHVGRALALIDAQISRAMQDGSWDDVQKWHQVKLRVRRMRLAAGRTGAGQGGHQLV